MPEPLDTRAKGLFCPKLDPGYLPVTVDCDRDGDVLVQGLNAT